MSFDPKLVRRGVRHLRSVDPVMDELIGELGPFQLKAERRRFVALARSIVGQQISAKAAAAIWRRLIETVKPQRMTARNIAALSIDELKSAGISTQKATYLHDLAAKTSDGTIVLSGLTRLSDDDVIETLVQVKGIGVWTAQMFLMFSLCRPDVFAPDDLGLRAAIRRLYDLDDLPDKSTSLSIAEPWQPYQTIASWYLWRSTESEP